MSSLASADRNGVVGDGQRRHVSLLFSDLCDYTALNEIADPEEAATLRRRIEEVAVSVVEKHGGAVSQFYGDGILAVFGFSEPQEDDARRAIEAALELHATIRDAIWDDVVPIGFELRLHSGVHEGLVFGRTGDTLRGRYELTGDTVNTAARLCAVATRDEILVSGSTLHGVEAFFATQPALPHALKGKKLPVSAHRVTGRSDVRTRFDARSRRGLTQFVNRTLEFEQLDALLAQACDGHGQLVVITGMAGIGKTRLIEEFQRRAAERGVYVLQGGCDSYGEICPLEPLLQILRPAFDIDAGASAEQAVLAIDTRLQTWGGAIAEHRSTFLRLLSLDAWPSGTTELEAMRPVVDAIAQLVDTLCARAPLMLILDDWQWADDSSRSVFVRICETLSVHRVCVLVGARQFVPDAYTVQPSCILDVQPFGKDHSQQVVAALRPHDLELSISASLHQRSGGNPLFLEELCRALPSTASSSADALDYKDVPNTVQGVIQTRVAKLPPPELEVLRIASVIGMEFSSMLLAHVMGAERIEASLASLIGGDLIYATDSANTFRFKHGITRDVVYEMVRIGSRRAAHQTIAEAIAGNIGAVDQAEALAYHYRSAGDHEQAAKYAELAGNKAMVASSLDRARFHYAAAMESLEKLRLDSVSKRRWLAISGKWAAPCSYSPTREQLSTLTRAGVYAVELGDARAQARNCHWLGWFHYVFGDFAESIRAYQQAIDVAEASGYDDLLPQFWTNLGQAYGAAGKYRDALPALARGLDLKRSRVDASGSRGLGLGVAHALGCRGVIASDLGDFDSAARDFEQALAIVGGSGHAMEASVLSQRAMAEARRGDFAACAETAAHSRKTAERANSTYVFAMSTLFEAYARWMLGPSPDKLEQMQKALEWLEQRDLGLYISFAYGCAAEAFLSAGDAKSARIYALRALARADRGDPLGEAMAYRVLARIHVELGPGSQALRDESLNNAFRSGAERESKRETALTRLLVLKLTPRGAARETADAAIENIISELERMGMPWYAEQARALSD